jgi:hypothetical protein
MIHPGEGEAAGDTGQGRVNVMAEAGAGSGLAPLSYSTKGVVGIVHSLLSRYLFLLELFFCNHYGYVLCVSQVLQHIHPNLPSHREASCDLR